MTNRSAIGVIRQRRGLTLLELTVVIVIMALVASMVVISRSGTIQRFRAQRAFQEIKTFDQRARQFAEGRNLSVEITIDPADKLLKMQYADGVQLSGKSLYLDANSRLVVLDFEGEHSSATSVAISPTGISELYAVGIRKSDSSSRWLLFLGAGQVLDFESQEALEDWL